MRKEVDVYVIVNIIRPGLLGVWDAIKAVFYGRESLPVELMCQRGLLDIVDERNDTLTGERQPN